MSNRLLNNIKLKNQLLISKSAELGIPYKDLQKLNLYLHELQSKDASNFPEVEIVNKPEYNYELERPAGATHYIWVTELTNKS